MLLNLVIAASLLIVTTIIHASAMEFMINQKRKYTQAEHHKFHLKPVFIVSMTILFMFNVTVFEVIIWALTLMSLGALQGIEEALYFSMVTYTTLGYGDVLLDPHWRLLGSFAAANGIIMFGWTTAITIAVVQQTYFHVKLIKD